MNRVDVSFLTGISTPYPVPFVLLPQSARSFRAHSVLTDPVLTDSILKRTIVIRQICAPSQEKDGRHNCWHPTEHCQADLPNRSGKARLLAHPGEPAPQHDGRKGSTQRHSNTTNTNHPQPFLLAPQFQSPRAHPHLRCSHESGIRGQRLRMQRANHPASSVRIVAAVCALLQMSSQPGLLRSQESFPQRDEFLCPFMRAVRHACVPFSGLISMLSPRYKRDFTVPSGAPVTAAISSRANSSWKRKTIASRHSAGMLANAALMRSVSWD